jgi:SAM-dependent methyltransferase
MPPPVVEAGGCALNGDIILAVTTTSAVTTPCGCGTGALTLRLAAAIGDDGRIAAVDISEPMLAVARQRVGERGLCNCYIAARRRRRYSRSSRPPFDVATSRMGVMFFGDPSAAFRNIGGALKPRGRLVFACWAPLAENGHWLISYDIALRHLGPPATQPAHEPGPLAFDDPDYIRGFLTATGFAEITIERAHPTIIGGSPEEEARHALMMSPTARLIEEKEPNKATAKRSPARSRRRLSLKPPRARSGSRRPSFWLPPAARLECAAAGQARVIRDATAAFGRWCASGKVSPAWSEMAVIRLSLLLAMGLTRDSRVSLVATFRGNYMYLDQGRVDRILRGICMLVFALALAGGTA